MDVPTTVPTMSSLLKRENSPFWFCAYTARDGRRLKKSTKVRIRPLRGQNKTAAQLEEEARTLCIEWAGLERESGDIEVQARRVVNDAVQRATGKPIHFYTVRGWIDSWMGGITPQVAPGTLTKYRGHLNEFLEIIGAKAESPLGHVTKDDITGYRDGLIKRGLAPSTVRVGLKAIKMPFAAAARERYIEKDPAAAVSMGRKPHGKAKAARRDYFKPDQIQALLTAAAGTSWEGMVLLAATHGFRR